MKNFKLKSGAAFLLMLGLFVLSIVIPGDVLGSANDVGPDLDPSLAMGSVIVAPDMMRAARTNLEQFLKNKGLLADNLIISEYDMYLEGTLVPGQNRYEFSVVDAGNSNKALERKLPKNDGYLVIAVGIQIRKQGATAGAEQAGNYIPFTHPDPNYFVGAAGGVTEVQALWCLYNGFLKFSTDGVERVKGLSCQNFLYAPESQTFIQAGSQIATEYGQFGPTMETRGLHPLAVYPFIEGDRENIFELILGKGQTTYIDGAIDAAGNGQDVTRNVVHVVTKGLHIKNINMEQLKSAASIEGGLSI